MKVPDSGMPEETYWNSLFNIPLIVDWLDLKSVSGPIAEIGCGYGTFTVPIAKQAMNGILTFDVEPSMIDAARQTIQKAGLGNVRFFLCDIIDQGTGLESNSVGMVMLFNILHSTDRRAFLEEACRILKPSGVVAIIHWRKDIQTPRGPNPLLRPDRKMIFDSITGLDLCAKDNGRILEPFHWGIRLIKT